MKSPHTLGTVLGFETDEHGSTFTAGGLDNGRPTVERFLAANPPRVENVLLRVGSHRDGCLVFRTEESVLKAAIAPGAWEAVYEALEDDTPAPVEIK